MKVSNKTLAAARATAMILAPGAFLIGVAAKSAYDTARSAYRDARGLPESGDTVETTEDKSAAA